MRERVRRRGDIATADNSLRRYSELNEKKGIANGNLLGVATTPINVVLLSVTNSTNRFWLVSPLPPLGIPGIEISAHLVLTHGVRRNAGLTFELGRTELPARQEQRRIHRFRL